jgi:hypothetical protein
MEHWANPFCLTQKEKAFVPAAGWTLTYIYFRVFMIQTGSDWRRKGGIADRPLKIGVQHGTILDVLSVGRKFGQRASATMYIEV